MAEPKGQLTMFTYTIVHYGSDGVRHETSGQWESASGAEWSVRDAYPGHAIYTVSRDCPPHMPRYEALVYRNVSSTAGLSSYAHKIGE